MLVYYYTYVERPRDMVEHDLRQALQAVSDTAASAYRYGESLVLTLQAGESDGLAKQVTFKMGEPLRGRTGSTFPLEWAATGARWLFPTMSADLVLEPIDDHATKVTFRGSYRPPLGPIGEAMDRAALHRVAEATVKHFVDRLVDVLETGFPSTSPT